MNVVHRSPVGDVVSEDRKVQPTRAELAILRVLWCRGPSTVRDVHESLGGNDRRTRYTTTLKQMQVMVDKRLVKRDESRRSHIYTAGVQESDTQQSVVTDFVDRVFEGSVQKMLIHALESGKVTDEEILEIKRLIRDWERRK